MTARAHFAVATTLSGIAVTSLLAAGLATSSEALLYLSTGMIGGYLPDIDADNSRPLKITFHWGAIGVAFLALFCGSGRYSAAELGCIWLTVYLFGRVVVVKVFEKLTVHRGLFHSVPSALLFAVLTVVLCGKLLPLKPATAWCAGIFCLMGYLAHLLLDEWEGLNLFGVGTRKSLGTACKIWSRQNPFGAFFLYVLAAAMVFAAPTPRPFLDTFKSGETYRSIRANLWPKDLWFSRQPDPAQPPPRNPTAPAR